MPTICSPRAITQPTRGLGLAEKRPSRASASAVRIWRRSVSEKAGGGWQDIFRRPLGFGCGRGRLKKGFRRPLRTVSAESGRYIAVFSSFTSLSVSAKRPLSADALAAQTV
ncbi:hypothetical protein [Kingella potus]|uniref:hypothetical protein n=1 Tax=Kingella potus TaxID=265175 RepID=UPI001FD62018|nr:hypothetical protein [Kingella potus]UOP01966.1 hypothetical protein LVJ84_13025 [Kingella potus]